MPTNACLLTILCFSSELHLHLVQIATSKFVSGLSIKQLPRPKRLFNESKSAKQKAKSVKTN